jgi:cytidylate kinase
MRMHLDEGDIASRMLLEWSLRQKALGEVGTGPPPRPAVVTFSDQIGSDGKEILAALRAELGSDWHIWDRDLLEEIARRANKRLQLLEAVDERAQSQIDLTIRSLLSVPMVEEATYLHQLARVLLALAQQGRAIIVGRGGHLLLRDALKVRCRAPHAYRVAKVAQMEGLSHQEAERRVREVDRRRADFIRVEFEHDIDNADDYDLVLRSDTLGVSTAVAALAAAVRARFPV